MAHSLSRSPLRSAVYAAGRGAVRTKRVPHIDVARRRRASLSHTRGSSSSGPPPSQRALSSGRGPRQSSSTSLSRTARRGAVPAKRAQASQSERGPASLQSPSSGAPNGRRAQNPTVRQATDPATIVIGSVGVPAAQADRPCRFPVAGRLPTPLPTSVLRRRCLNPRREVRRPEPRFVPYRPASCSGQKDDYGCVACRPSPANSAVLSGIPLPALPADPPCIACGSPQQAEVAKCHQCDGWQQLGSTGKLMRERNGRCDHADAY